MTFLVNVSGLALGVLVPVAVALIGIVPNLGRIRRIERIVALLKDVQDPEGRERLLAIRDRFIASLEPGPHRDVRIYRWGVALLAVGYFAAFATILAQTGTLGYLGLPKQSAVYPAVFTVGVVVAVVGLGMVQIALRRRRRWREQRRAEAREQAKAKHPSQGANTPTT